MPEIIEFLNSQGVVDYVLQKWGTAIAPSTVRAAKASGALKPSSAHLDGDGRATSFGYTRENVRAWVKSGRARKVANGA